jgi:hypothetical protein
MKSFKYFIFLSLFFIFSTEFANSQVIYSSKVDSITNLVSLTSLTKYVRELTGDTITTIGESPFLIYSRFFNTLSNQKAAQYIFEKFLRFGLQSRYQSNKDSTTNVIAKKTGTKYPNQQYIICAHYDNYSNSSTDTIPGADDNASGVAVVLEAARILSGISTDYTIIFIAFDTEEFGCRGSYMYADSARIKGDSIKGVLNLDMLGYDGNGDFKSSISNYTLSHNLSDDYQNVIQLYNLGLNLVYYNANSDQSAFIYKGYPAICSSEDMNDFNPYYHKWNDKLINFNLTYFLRLSKAAIATVTTWANVSQNIIEIPTSFSLRQNYPNPFNPGTKISFDIARFGKVKIIICDVMGREMLTFVNELLNPGRYEIPFDGSQLTSGVYFYKLVTDGYSETKRMILLK